MPAPAEVAGSYAARMSAVLQATDWAVIEPLALALARCWRERRSVFLAGNGGSAGNANHIANDFLYPVSKRIGHGIRVSALSDNPAKLTCLANDEGYEAVFAAQLRVMALPGDVVIAFSGSGNSPNILRLLEAAREIGVESFAILGFDGGAAKGLADHPIHFPVDDMQISEDLQTVVCHMAVQWLFTQRDAIAMEGP